MNPILYVLCGCPGCGKSYFGQHYSAAFNAFYVSRDKIRFSLLKDDEDYFAHEDEVFVRFYSTIREYLKEGMNVIADATHINIKSRKKLLNALSNVYFDVIYVYFNTSFETCRERNSEREGRKYVPLKVMQNMWDNFIIPTVTETKKCIGIMCVKGE